MTYDELDPDVIDETRNVTHDEVLYMKRKTNTSIPLGSNACAALSALLRELGEIARRAPGGHQFLIDEANRWAVALDASEAR